MNNQEFAQKALHEGWTYVLCSINPSILEDVALAEALTDAQEAFKILVRMTPEVEVHFSEDQFELNFGD